MKRAGFGQLQGTVFDILVVGGGVTGAHAAREAALRGLSVVLLEKEDFASGTSSRSTKLLHGGVRYLQSFQFKLVREACRERELMLELAPHLAHVRPFIYVLYDGYPEAPWLLNLGLTFYDLFSGSPLKRRHHMLNARQLLELEPQLNPAGLIGGGYYYDFLTDDARFTLDTVKGACEAGALAANYMQVTGVLMENGRVSGVQAVDLLSGETGEIRARQVVNCAGVWVDKVRFLEPGVTSRLLRPTKGIHIAVRKRDFPLNHTIFLRSPRDQRVVWPIPALDEDLVYIGTTDTDYQGSLDHVIATQQDIDYLLEVANFTIPQARLGYRHVVSTWAGLRPLIKPEGELATSSVSREHKIFTSPGGLLNIAGGKLTTARVMGQQVIDEAIRLLGIHHHAKGIRPSLSHRQPISGGEAGECTRADQALQELPLSEAVRRRWRMYGGNGLKLAEIVRGDPVTAQEIGQPGLTLAEVRHALQEEMACTLTDFFTRRASVFYWTEDGGLRIAQPVAVEMARWLGWSAAETDRQIEQYTAWVGANRFMPVEPAQI
jgi:glycerol-3-phosphate dehydrogenase